MVAAFLTRLPAVDQSRCPWFRPAKSIDLRLFLGSHFIWFRFAVWVCENQGARMVRRADFYLVLDDLLACSCACTAPRASTRRAFNSDSVRVRPSSFSACRIFPLTSTTCSESG